MDDTARSALQRAGLTTLVNEFHLLCLHGRLLDTAKAATPPPSYVSAQGVWVGAVVDGVKTLTLHFKEAGLGEFSFSSDHGHLSGWHWIDGSGDGGYRRLQAGPTAEQKAGCPEGPVPDAQFAAMWEALHGSCKDYVYGNELRPRGLGLALFPPR